MRWAVGCNLFCYQIKQHSSSVHWTPLLPLETCTIVFVISFTHKQNLIKLYDLSFVFYISIKFLIMVSRFHRTQKIMNFSIFKNSMNPLNRLALFCKQIWSPNGDATTNQTMNTCTCPPRGHCKISSTCTVCLLPLNSWNTLNCLIIAQKFYLIY